MDSGHPLMSVTPGDGPSGHPLMSHQWVVEITLLTPRWGRSPRSLLSLPWYYLAGEFGALLQHEIGSTQSPLSLCWHGWRLTHSFFGGIQELLSKSFFVLLGCSFPGLSAWECRFLLGTFFCLHSLTIPDYHFSNSKSGIHEAKRKPKALTTVSFLEFQDL